jgi:hypothetical protein
LGSLARRRRRSDLSAVAMHDALHGRQSDADARKLILPVQALERLKQLLRMRHVESDAVVHDMEHPLPAVIASEHTDGRRGRVHGVFPGVAQQVPHHDFHHAGVGPGGQPPLDLPRHRSLRIGARKLRQDLLGQRRQIDAIPPHFAPHAAR